MRKFTNELNSGVSPGPENNVFADLWQQYGRVMLNKENSQKLPLSSKGVSYVQEEKKHDHCHTGAGFAGDFGSGLRSCNDDQHTSIASGDSAPSEF